jgi:protein-tyrosine phosphatase
MSSHSSPSGRPPLRIEGLVNIRDLGGIPTHTGQPIARGRLIRSDNPRNLASHGWQQLHERIGPRVIIDLRSETEVDRDNYTVDSLKTRRVGFPMMPQSGITEDEIAAGACSNLIDDYLTQLAVNADSIAGALSVIAQSSSAPVMVHCTAGKDRTGILVALVLRLLNVPDDEIIVDYAASAPAMVEIVSRIRNTPLFQENGLAQAPPWIFAAEKETMAGFLAGLDDRYGGAAGWARAHRLDRALIEDLRESLLVSHHR